MRLLRVWIVSARAAPAIPSRFRTSPACNASISVGIDRDPLAHGIQRALPRETQDSIRKAQFRAGNKLRIDAEFDRDRIVGWRVS